VTAVVTIKTDIFSSGKKEKWCFCRRARKQQWHSTKEIPAILLSFPFFHEKVLSAFKAVVLLFPFTPLL
jgi:hypothetical protein